jgi:hypothetical protein
MKNRVMEWKDLPVFFWGVGQGKRFFFFKNCVWCREWTVHRSLSTWTVDNELSMQALRGCQIKQFPSSWHVPWRVHNRTSLLCLANVGPKGTSSILQIRTFNFGEPPKIIFYSDGPIKLAHCKFTKKKNTCEAPHLI